MADPHTAEGQGRIARLKAAPPDYLVCTVASEAFTASSQTTVRDSPGDPVSDLLLPQETRSQLPDTPCAEPVRPPAGGTVPLATGQEPLPLPLLAGTEDTGPAESHIVRGID